MTGDYHCDLGGGKRTSFLCDYSINDIGTACDVPPEEKSDDVLLGDDLSISISLAEIDCQEASNSMRGIELFTSTSGRGIYKSSICSRFSEITILRTSLSFSEHLNTSLHSEFLLIQMDQKWICPTAVGLIQ